MMKKKKKILREKSRTKKRSISKRKRETSPAQLRNEEAWPIF